MRSLSIRNFRGIRECDWHTSADLVALVGPGDSTKTTLIDALGAVLSPTYTLRFTDADFFGGNTDEPILITAVITALPDSLIQENQFGKDQSGICPDGSLLHDPVAGTDPCLVVRLTVEKDLEPVWEVIRPGVEETRTISGNQRQRLGFFRIDDQADNHLRWTRTSALSGLTEQRQGAAVILDAHRQARDAVFDAQPEALTVAASLAQTNAREVGSAPFTKLQPGLEPSSASSTHALMLHDGQIPLTQFGLGTRRLTSFGIQSAAAIGGSIIAIDEVEHGLEPHRLSHLLNTLRLKAEATSVQVIITTHSPMAVESLGVKDLAVVRSVEGITTVLPVPFKLENAQGVFRSAPSALLARKIVVGEGATEVGLLRGLFRAWDAARLNQGQASSVSLGVAVVDGKGGTSAPDRAHLFKSLGYPSMVLMDGDDPQAEPNVATAEASGVCFARWQEGRALEDELAYGLDADGLRELVAQAATHMSEEAVRSAVAAKLSVNKLEGIDPDLWTEACGKTPDEVRNAVGLAAKGKSSWFKTVDGGEALAAILITHWESIKAKTLGTTLERVSRFVYGDTLND
ncbi:ATP-dependent endonuclease [Arthrobacter sp. ISL-95]|uniref:ATP-dependent nuclease n=1 Tax=Arthrobacter sp. ISL-95 TaxID=2819116 RepID=UPI0025709101|nr:ATP-binding protein [Arthrobacter sp. ISL-95]